MQQKSILSTPISGYVIESNQNPWIPDREKATVSLPYNRDVMLKKEEYFCDGHMWNVVYYGGNIYLLDLAMIADGTVVKQKIEFNPAQDRDLFTIPLNNSIFKYRHYQQHGSVKIEML